MKRKYKLVLLMIFSLLLLAGWGKKSVELLNDKKLIDLNVALGNCILGAEDLIQDEGNQTQNPENPATPKPTMTPRPTATPRPIVTPRPTATPVPTEAPKPRTIVIVVRDQKITYDSKERLEASKLKEQIQMDHGELVSFRLVDDFAEAHVYRKIMAILAELQEEIGIRYTRD